MYKGLGNLSLIVILVTKLYKDSWYFLVSFCLLSNWSEITVSFATATVPIHA